MWKGHLVVFAILYWQEIPYFFQPRHQAKLKSTGKWESSWEPDTVPSNVQGLVGRVLHSYLKNTGDNGLSKI